MNFKKFLVLFFLNQQVFGANTLVCWNGLKTDNIINCPVNLNENNSAKCTLSPIAQQKNRAQIDKLLQAFLMSFKKDKKIPEDREIQCDYKGKKIRYILLNNDEFQVSVHISYKTKSGNLIKDSVQSMSAQDIAFDFEKSELYLRLTKDGNTDIKVNHFLVSEKQPLLNLNSSKIEKVTSENYSPSLVCANGKEVKNIIDCPNTIDSAHSNNVVPAAK